jgi:hypothetical protein
LKNELKFAGRLAEKSEGSSLSARGSDGSMVGGGADVLAVGLQRNVAGWNLLRSEE